MILSTFQRSHLDKHIVTHLLSTHLMSKRISIDDNDDDGDDTQASSYVHVPSQLVPARPMSDILDVPMRSHRLISPHPPFSSLDKLPGRISSRWDL